MSDDVLDLGEVDIPLWTSLMNGRNYIPFREVENAHGPRSAFMLHDINFVRTCIRKRRYGESSDPTKTYRIQVNWPNGETAEWEFDHTVAWPREDGEARDWRGEWMRNFGGAA